MNQVLFYFRLLGVCYAAGLADDGDLHLTRIGHLVLNLGGDLVREFGALLVVHLVGSHDNAKLTSSLDGIGLGNARIAHGYCLKVVESLDVCLNNLSTGTRTGTRDGIANLNDWSKKSVHLHLVVVSTNGIADISASP